MTDNHCTKENDEKSHSRLKTQNSRLLVIGDSLVFGQGLREEFKFAEITARRLESEFFGGEKRVRVEWLARSGARLFLRESEAEALRRAEFDEFFPRCSEINVSFPSVEAQINSCRTDSNADFVIFSGGITEITVTGILNVYRSEKAFRVTLDDIFLSKMPEIFRRLGERFPNALIIISGYYQMISEHTPTRELFDTVNRLFGVPPFLQKAINNPLNRIYLNRVKRQMIRRCEVWKEFSDTNFRLLTDRLNAELDRRQFLFVESPLTAQNAYAAPQTLLWKLNERGVAEDDCAAQRRAVCRSTFDEIYRKTGLKYRSSVCELAALGHPNREGAKLYADAIFQAVRDALEK